MLQLKSSIIKLAASIALLAPIAVVPEAAEAGVKIRLSGTTCVEGVCINLSDRGGHKPRHK